MSFLAALQAQAGSHRAPPTWEDGRRGPIVYEPYVREMRVWADLFESVVVLGSSWGRTARGNLAPYERPNIRWIPSGYTYRVSRRGRVPALTQLPGMIWQVVKVVQSADVVHLRSPSHFGLVGAVVVRLLRRRSITKWAGENGAYRGERIPSRLNRWAERVLPKGHVVLVYGPPRGPQPDQLHTRVDGRGGAPGCQGDVQRSDVV